MVKGLLVLGALLSMYVQPAQAQPVVEEVYRLTEIGERPDGRLHQILSFSAPRDTVNPERWIIERVRNDTIWCGVRLSQGGCKQSNVKSHDWIDSNTCPSLIPALEQLARIPIPSFAGPRGITSFDISHVAVLTIEGRPRSEKKGAYPRYGGSTLTQVSVREQVGFFRQWWDSAGAALKPCWRDVAPLFADKRLEATLRTEP